MIRLILWLIGINWTKVDAAPFTKQCGVSLKKTKVQQQRANSKTWKRSINNNSWSIFRHHHKPNLNFLLFPGEDALFSFISMNHKQFRRKMCSSYKRWENRWRFMSRLCVHLKVRPANYCLILFSFARLIILSGDWVCDAICCDDSVESFQTEAARARHTQPHSYKQAQTKNELITIWITN